MNPFDPTRQELSWSGLLGQSGLSRRTLNSRLKDMERRGLVKRRVDNGSEKYPPPVYYRLVQRNPTVSDILSKHRAYDRTIEKNLTFDESPREFLEKLTTGLSPVVIYAVLKSIETRSDRPLANAFENLRFTLEKYLVYAQKFDQSDPKALLQKFAEVGQRPQLFQADLDSLLAALRDRFPEEIQNVDAGYQRRVKRQIERGPMLNPRGRKKKPRRKDDGI